MSFTIEVTMAPKARADDHGNGEIEHVAPHHEFFEVFQHVRYLSFRVSHAANALPPSGSGSPPRDDGVNDPRYAAPTIGASQNNQSCSTAHPPTNSAGPVLRAGFTDRLVTGIPIR